MGASEKLRQAFDAPWSTPSEEDDSSANRRSRKPRIRCTYSILGAVICTSHSRVAIWSLLFLGLHHRLVRYGTEVGVKKHGALLFRRVALGIAEGTLTIVDTWLKLGGLAVTAAKSEARLQIYRVDFYQNLDEMLTGSRRRHVSLASGF